MALEKPEISLYRFGLFEADLGNGRLLRDGERVKIQDQPFLLLLILLRRAGEIVSREDLRQELWPSDTYVEFDVSLNAAFKKLRYALGDSADNPLFIETVLKRGYRFIAPVEIVYPQRAGSDALALPQPARERHEAEPEMQDEAQAIERGDGTLGASLAPELRAPAPVLVPFPAPKPLAAKPDVLPFPAPPSSAAQPGAQTDATSSAEPVSDVALQTTPTPQRRLWTRVIAAAAVVVSIAALALYRLTGPGRHARPFQALKFTQLTTTGKARDAAISPDGKYVAYTSGDFGDESIWVRQVATRSDIQIVPPAEVTCAGLTFSHDGSYVYYVESQKSFLRGTAYRVPALGGESRKVMDNVMGPVTLSPDDQRMAFIRFEGQQTELIVANSDGSGERKLATRKDAIGFGWPPSPAWSPDGKVIAVMGVDRSTGTVRHAGVSVFDVAGGGEKPIGPETDSDRLAWLGDGSGLILVTFDASDPGQGNWRRLWQLTYPGGELRQITHDLSFYEDVGVTADSKTLAAVRVELPSSVWVAPASDPSSAKQIASSSSGWDGWVGLTWTPDGELVYSSTATGAPNWWLMQADGSHARQLTADIGFIRHPSACADGRTIVFDSWASGFRSIWRVDTDGLNLRRLTSNRDAVNPSCSPDSKWVIFDSMMSDKWSLWRVPIEGGDPTQITDYLSDSPAISPDGRWIAFLYSPDPARLDQQKIAIIPFAGGRPAKILDLQRAAKPRFLFDFGIKWTPDERALAYLDARNGVLNIWTQSLNGGPPKPLTDFDSSGQVWSFAWSHDGKQLAMARGALKSDVILISNSE